MPTIGRCFQRSRSGAVAEPLVPIPPQPRARDRPVLALPTNTEGEEQDPIIIRRARKKNTREVKIAMKSMVMVTSSLSNSGS